MPIASVEDALKRSGVNGQTLSPSERDGLRRGGYTVLRGVFSEALRERLIGLFEQDYVPSDRWPEPRGFDTRHAMLDNEPEVQQACLAPPILASAYHLLGRRFFLRNVQGRDPHKNGGHQSLHRDWVAPHGPAPMVIALAFLEPFSAANGATRLVPGSHRLAGEWTDMQTPHPEEIVVAGNGGDVLVMDGFLVHGGTRNVSGAHRRSLQIDLQAFEEYASHTETRDLDVALEIVGYWLGKDT